MSEFRPFYTAHAIEKCTINVSFDGPIPEKLYSRFIKEIEEELGGLHIKRGDNHAAFKFDTVSERLVAVDDDYGPATFNNLDNSLELVILPHAITFTTHRYVRWQTFLGAFNAITESIFNRFEDVVNVGSVGLEYWDRFIWTGSWEDFDLKKLLRSNIDMISERVFRAEREAHSHVGWFAYQKDCRRLNNVNIDVIAFGATHNPTHLDPSVGIYILVNDQGETQNIKRFASVDLSDRLEGLHQASKALLTDLLLPDWAKRIGMGG